MAWVRVQSGESFAKHSKMCTSLVLMLRCPSITALLIPEVFLRSGTRERIGGPQLEHGEGKLSSLCFGTSRDSKSQPPDCVRDLIAQINEVLLLPILHENL